MRKPENTFVAGIHRLLPATTPYREKMNNPYRGGTPDWWYSGKTDLWVEYKYLPRTPVRADVLPDLSGLQRLWLKGRLAEGRNLAVIVGCPDGGVIFEAGAWDTPMPAPVFCGLLQTKQELANWIAHHTNGGNNRGDKIRSRHLQDTRRHSPRD